MRDDLDLAWKEALALFLPEFLALFLPEVHGAIDWTQPVDFLEGETRRLRRNLRGRRRHADVVVRVRRRDGVDALVVVHVEIQSRRDEGLGLRMRIYNDRLFDRYRCPVYSLAVLGDGSPGWRPTGFEVEVWGCRSRLDFPTLKLLDWKPRLRELEGSSNPFSLVVAAHLAAMETRPHDPARCDRAERLVELMLQRGFRQERVDGLFHVLEAMMPMTDVHYERFERRVASLEEDYGMKLITRSERRGLERGRQEGRQEGLEIQARHSILLVARARFGEAPAGLAEALDRVTDSVALEGLLQRAATAADAAELMGALPKEP